jgi:hypothetical protein
MFKHAARNLILALTLTALVSPFVYADAPSTTTPAVTGGDPEPTSPTVVQTILTFLYLA